MLSRYAGCLAALWLVVSPAAHARAAPDEPRDAPVRASGESPEGSARQASEDEGGGGPGGLLRPPGSRLHPGLFLGDEYRYGNMMLPLRVLTDLAAIPAGMARWEGQDWAAFSLVTITTASLMMPFDFPLDARIQHRLHEWLGPDHFRVWTPLGDVLVNGAIYGSMAGILAYGLLKDDARAVQLVSLSAEAFAVTQAFHLTFKLLLGREGPRNGDGLGQIFGPSASFSLFPAGTPSGHTASLYALLGVATAYLDNLPLSLALHVFGLAFAATIIMDDYHFLSDVIWGGAMGFAIGQWVVHHRANSSVSHGKSKPLFMVVPMVSPRGSGLAAGFTF